MHGARHIGDGVVFDFRRAGFDRDRIIADGAALCVIAIEHIMRARCEAESLRRFSVDKALDRRGVGGNFRIVDDVKVIRRDGQRGALYCKGILPDERVEVAFAARDGHRDVIGARGGRAVKAAIVRLRAARIGIVLDLGRADDAVRRRAVCKLGDGRRLRRRGVAVRPIAAAVLGAPNEGVLLNVQRKVAARRRVIVCGDDIVDGIVARRGQLGHGVRIDGKLDIVIKPRSRRDIEVVCKFVGAARVPNAIGGLFRNGDGRGRDRKLGAVRRRIGVVGILHHRDDGAVGAHLRRGAGQSGPAAVLIYLIREGQLGLRAGKAARDICAKRRRLFAAVIDEAARVGDSDFELEGFDRQRAALGCHRVVGDGVGAFGEGNGVIFGIVACRVAVLIRDCNVREDRIESIAVIEGAARQRVGVCGRGAAVRRLGVVDLDRDRCPVDGVRRLARIDGACQIAADDVIFIADGDGHLVAARHGGHGGAVVRRRSVVGGAAVCIGKVEVVCADDALKRRRGRVRRAVGGGQPIPLRRAQNLRVDGEVAVEIAGREVICRRHIYAPLVLARGQRLTFKFDPLFARIFDLIIESRRFCLDFLQSVAFKVNFQRRRLNRVAVSKVARHDSRCICRFGDHIKQLYRIVADSLVFDLLILIKIVKIICTPNVIIRIIEGKRQPIEAVVGRIWSLIRNSPRRAAHVATAARRNARRPNSFVIFFGTVDRRNRHNEFLDLKFDGEIRRRVVGRVFQRDDDAIVARAQILRKGDVRPAAGSVRDLILHVAVGERKGEVCRAVDRAAREGEFVLGQRVLIIPRCDIVELGDDFRAALPDRKGVRLCAAERVGGAFHREDEGIVAHGGVLRHFARRIGRAGRDVVALVEGIDDLLPVLCKGELRAEGIDVGRRVAVRPARKAIACRDLVLRLANGPLEHDRRRRIAGVYAPVRPSIVTPFQRDGEGICARIRRGEGIAIIKVNRAAARRAVHDVGVKVVDCDRLRAAGIGVGIF